MSIRLQVVIANPVGDNKTINLPNPSDELTLADVQAAFKPFFDNGYFISNNATYTAVKTAKIIQTTDTNLT